MKLFLKSVFSALRVPASKFCVGFARDEWKRAMGWKCLLDWLDPFSEVHTQRSLWFNQPVSEWGGG